jgi:hypothetical protein
MHDDLDKFLSLTYMSLSNGDDEQFGTLQLGANNSDFFGKSPSVTKLFLSDDEDDRGDGYIREGVALAGGLAGGLGTHIC